MINKSIFILIVFLYISSISRDALSTEGVLTVSVGDNLSKLANEIGITLEEIKTKCVPQNKKPPYIIHPNTTIDCSELIESKNKKKTKTNHNIPNNNRKTDDQKAIIKITDYIKSEAIGKKLESINNHQIAANKIMDDGFKQVIKNTEYDPKPTSLSVLIALLVALGSAFIIAITRRLRDYIKENLGKFRLSQITHFQKTN
jgi:hypothetical protein